MILLVCYRIYFGLVKAADGSGLDLKVGKGRCIEDEKNGAGWSKRRHKGREEERNRNGEQRICGLCVTLW